MSVDVLLKELGALGVQLWFEGNKLRFRAPKGALTAPQRAQLGLRKSEVLAQLRAAASATQILSPLSYSQRALWFLHNETPDSFAYNFCIFSARIISTVDEDCLQQAIQALCDRHASLRATFPLVDGVPMQRVQGNVTAVFDRHDVHGFDDEQLRAAVTAEYRRPFDFEHGPLFRTSLFTRGPQDHVLLMTVHHIAADGWSSMQLIDELPDLYAEAAGGAATPQPHPAVEYAEFTAWQAKMLEGEEGKRLADFWRLQMAAPRAVLELPSERPRPPLRSTRGASFSVDLDEHTSAEVRKMARDRGATVFVVMLAAFETLLFRYTGTTDIVVGTPTFGRNRPEFARVVGDFVNTLPLRVRLDATVSFDELMERVKRTLYAALDAQDYPFPLIVKDTQPARDPSRSPLFDILFVMQRFDQLQKLEPLFRPGSTEHVAFGGLQLAQYALDQQEGQFDLTLQIMDRPGPLLLQFKYNTDLFEEAMFARMSGHYRTLLGAACQDPTRPIGRMPLLTSFELAQLTKPAPSQPLPAAGTLHEVFEAQVRRTPDAIAVSCEGKHLSYSELNRRANQLAHRLRELGAAPDMLIGVCTERSLNLIVALIGILKSGGAYLPVDPAYPTERVSFMLEDGAVSLLVTEQSLHRLAPGHVQCVLVDHELTECPGHDLAPTARAVDPAYVIYTSGSTGRPKGVVVSHGSLMNFLCSMAREPGLTSTDVLAAVTTISFDIAGLEIYLPLLNGARVELISRESAANGRLLATTLAECGATVMQATPATWRMLMAADCRFVAGFRALCGGEALPRELADALLDRVGELWNMYGPTETTIWSTIERVMPGDGRITIGRPIANTQIYILDSSGELLPVGVQGEICIGGAGVALGYHNRPELTGERFVSDTFAAVPGARYYHTGDFGRWREDGRVEHLGRMDQQLKIRGFRVEPGEIEARLVAHDAVRQAVVVAREAAPGDLRLVAYVVYERAQDLTVSEVRRYLRQCLPEHMIPSLVVPLGSMPLTLNGKLDRVSLPDPFKQTAVARVDNVSLVTPMEKLLGEFWRDLLKIDRIDADDNFFDLGGHSLLTLRFAAAIEKRTGWRMDPRTLYFQNLRQIAATVGGEAVHGDVQ